MFALKIVFVLLLCVPLFLLVLYFLLSLVGEVLDSAEKSPNVRFRSSRRRSRS